ncbi:hypothetical protein WJ970_05100 [Achromobacter xylosoxidans]
MTRETSMQLFRAQYRVALLRLQATQVANVDHRAIQIGMAVHRHLAAGRGDRIQLHPIHRARLEPEIALDRDAARQRWRQRCALVDDGGADAALARQDSTRLNADARAQPRIRQP